MGKVALLAALFIITTTVSALPAVADPLDPTLDTHLYHDGARQQLVFAQIQGETFNTEESKDTDFIAMHPQGPIFTNLTIYEALSANEQFSKLVKLINYDEEYVEFLNNTSTNITFFAPDNRALTFPKRKEDMSEQEWINDVTLASFYDQFEHLAKLDGDDDEERKKRLKAILHAILEYHTLPRKLYRPALYLNSTYGTVLKAKDGSFGGQARRIGVRSHGVLPFGPLIINFYSFVRPHTVYASNGAIYTVSKPLLPPPSIMDELFLTRRFFVLTSALQKVGLDGWLSWRWKKAVEEFAEKGAIVTFFAPSDVAFNRLPPRLRRWLFSPFGAKALKKILSYHIVPDIILHADFFYNATDSEDIQAYEDGEYEEELYDTAASAYGPTLMGKKRQCNSRREGIGNVERVKRSPRFGRPAAGRLPSDNTEKIHIPPSEEAPHWPIPRIPHPRPTFKASLPTVLEGASLNVTVLKWIPPHRTSLPPFDLAAANEGRVDGKIDEPPGSPPRGPNPPHRAPPLFRSTIIVNGQHTGIEAVSRNGAVYTISRLLNPFRRGGHGCHSDNEEDVGDVWEDWEDWLPAWAEP